MATIKGKSARRRECARRRCCVARSDRGAELQPSSPCFIFISPLEASRLTLLDGRAEPVPRTFKPHAQNPRHSQPTPKGCCQRLAPPFPCWGWSGERSLLFKPLFFFLKRKSQETAARIFRSRWAEWELRPPVPSRDRAARPWHCRSPARNPPGFPSAPSPAPAREQIYSLLEAPPVILNINLQSTVPLDSARVKN